MVSLHHTNMSFANAFCSYDLPDDVFDKEKGDVKPTKPKKKGPLAKKAVNSTVQKRSFSDIEVCETFEAVYGSSSKRLILASHVGSNFMGCLSDELIVE